MTRMGKFRFVGALVAILAFGGGLLIHRGDREKGGNIISPAEAGPSKDEAKIAPVRGAIVLSDAPFAQEFGKGETSDFRELDLIQMAFQDYLSFVKPGYRRPIGDNRDFTVLLTGANPYKIAPIPPGHARINRQGELIDRRGIPFAIHPLAADAVEVRAAGKDRRLWTEDDLVSMSERGKLLMKKVLKGDGPAD